ncbi:MAG: NAD(P)-dependent alcohol dehydrogenase [Ardenticatenaceae bacterium]|nr:NAD(P)-dependent alcohol dehydrogenase [Ardenticatenaceae bacterium]
MKAMIATKYGSPEVLQLADVEKPTPKADEVLVQVVATAVNQADNHVLSGSLRFSTGIFKPKHPILGSDIAGVVAAVGKDVTQFQVGDAVFGDLSGQGRGGFAEYVAVPEAILVRKPGNLTFPQAAAVPMTAVTALQGLRDKGELQRGERVLINGASGGVGTFAVQIARALGGEVTAVASSQKLDMVRAIGADHVIDYKKEDFTQNGQQYDLIFDTVGNRLVAEYERALVGNGRFVTTTFLPALLWRRGSPKMVNLMAHPDRTDLLYLTQLIEAGRVVPIIDRCYPLAEVPEALRYLGEGHAQGKVIIQIAGH